MKTIKLIRLGACLTYITCAFFACTSENDGIDNHLVNDESAVSFSSYIKEVTRESEMTIATLQNRGFMVFANSTPTNWDTDGAASTPDFMYGQTVDYVEMANGLMGWEYYPLKFWPDSGKVSFFAYGPHTLATTKRVVSHSPSYTTGATNITYSLPALATEHNDIVAASCKDFTMDIYNGDVNVIFKHVLSKIQFVAQCNRVLDEETSLEITKLEVVYAEGAIRNRAVLDLEDVQESLNGGIWKDVSPASFFEAGSVNAGNILGNASGALSSLFMDSSVMNITSMDACLMLIPQAYNTGDVKLAISYVFTEDGASNVVNCELELPRIDEGWLPGMQYTYKLTFGANEVVFESDVTVGDWNDGGEYETVAEVPIHYPTSSYTLSSDGSVLKKWTGTESELLLHRDPAFKGVTSIGSWAFANCTSLETIVLPNGVTNIKDASFGYCNKLSKVVLPDGLISIGAGAFGFCSGLGTIDIPNGVTSIGGGAFFSCSSLEVINCYPVAPPTIDSNTLQGCPVIIHVPVGSLVAYQDATHWDAQNITDDL